MKTILVTGAFLNIDLRGLLLVVTDVSTTCVEVILRVNVVAVINTLNSSVFLLIVLTRFGSQSLSSGSVCVRPV